eukprot:TRINITY_DN5717_c0_g2_i1.p1 TRINITY_DN5717_c0_g2~~TRINITY_DN5717_c0_g2_i1.p1  ORF type:complete len:301 (-),score=33.09 TRINITY_DN5717_c0_g2_i1:137-940(-)
MISNNTNQTDPSIWDHSYTYAYSKYSCVSWVWVLHIMFAYFIVISGAFAVITRLIPKFIHFHVWFGRLFMIFMYWGMATSLLIHNSGLPLPILIFFLFLLIGLSIGWIAIKIHSQQMEQQSLRRVEEHLKASKLTTLNSISLSALVVQEKQMIANNKSFAERFLSYKALHGFCMVMAWYQMFGRTIITNPTKNPDCWTYPAYKSATGVANFIPSIDPHYAFQGKETQFVLAVTLPAVALFLVVGLIFSYVGGRRASSAEEQRNLALH